MVRAGDVRPGGQPAALLLGQHHVEGTQTIASARELPSDATLVVVEYVAHVADLIAEVRVLAPRAAVWVWLPEDRLEGASEAAAGEPDELIWGETLLRKRLEGWRCKVELEREYREHLAAYGGMVSLINEMAAHPDLQDVLRIAILRMDEIFSVNQVSVVLFQPGDEFGFVVAERDRRLDNIVIRLEDYPELLEIIRTCEPLVIANVFGDVLLRGVRDKLEEAGVSHRSSLLFPLVRDRDVVGALFLRSREQVRGVNERMMALGRIVAAVTSIAIGNALEQDKLLSEQRALIRDKETADRALANLQHFVDFFEQARDGIVVTDAQGAIRYLNTSAAEILQRDRAGLKGFDFVELLSPQYHRLARRAIQGERVGAQRYVDLLVPAGADEIVISAAIRPLSGRDNVLVSFRDVTELREIESELRQTKEFLENLIQSSVDGIVAADTEGVIILFNRAAERMLGYTARHAVGTLSLGDLFTTGGAQDIMRRLRSDSYGGRGRLELIRRDMISKNDQVVPVNLTASIIYEDEEEIASVIILTDLRERMRIEEKLSQAQRQLQLSERQAVAVELAGAAAHELNQPLTSILGYTALLKRKLEEDTPHRKPIDVICREAERMAEIVRRLGQITQYKSRHYVGGSTILDFGDGTGPGDEGDLP